MAGSGSSSRACSRSRRCAALGVDSRHARRDVPRGSCAHSPSLPLPRAAVWPPCARLRTDPRGPDGERLSHPYHDGRVLAALHHCAPQGCACRQRRARRDLPRARPPFLTPACPPSRGPRARVQVYSMCTQVGHASARGPSVDAPRLRMGRRAHGAQAFRRSAPVHPPARAVACACRHPRAPAEAAQQLERAALQQLLLLRQGVPLGARVAADPRQGGRGDAPRARAPLGEPQADGALPLARVQVPGPLLRQAPLAARALRGRLHRIPRDCLQRGQARRALGAPRARAARARGRADRPQAGEGRDRDLRRHGRHAQFARGVHHRL